MMALPATRISLGPGEAVYALTLAPELEAFQGHFQGDPVLPGVVQVDWAARLGQEAFGALGTFSGLDRIKFLAPIRPLEPLRLHLKHAGCRLEFRCLCGTELRASGTLLFAERP